MHCSGDNARHKHRRRSKVVDDDDDGGLHLDESMNDDRSGGRCATDLGSPRRMDPMRGDRARRHENIVRYGIGDDEEGAYYWDDSHGDERSHGGRLAVEDRIQRTRIVLVATKTADDMKSKTAMALLRSDGPNSDGRGCGPVRGERIRPTGSMIAHREDLERNEGRGQEGGSRAEEG